MPKKLSMPRLLFLILLLLLLILIFFYYLFNSKKSSTSDDVFFEEAPETPAVSKTETINKYLQKATDYYNDCSFLNDEITNRLLSGINLSEVEEIGLLQDSLIKDSGIENEINSKDLSFLTTRVNDGKNYCEFMLVSLDNRGFLYFYDKNNEIKKVEVDL